MTIAEAVQGDAVFAVAAQAEIADPDPEGDPERPSNVFAARPPPGRK